MIQVDKHSIKMRNLLLKVTHFLVKVQGHDVPATAVL